MLGQTGRCRHFIHIDLREPVHAVLNLLEYEAHKKQVELRFEASKDLPLILANSDGIQQIVLNLDSMPYPQPVREGESLYLSSPAKRTPVPPIARLLKRYN